MGGASLQKLLQIPCAQAGSRGIVHQHPIVRLRTLAQRLKSRQHRIAAPRAAADRYDLVREAAAQGSIGERRRRERQRDPHEPAPDTAPAEPARQRARCDDEKTRREHEERTEDVTDTVEGERQQVERVGQAWVVHSRVGGDLRADQPGDAAG